MSIRRKVKRHQLDRVDAEAIREMLQSRGWKLFIHRVGRLQASKRIELEQPQAEIDTAGIRGFLEAINAIAAIPDILNREGSRAAAGEDG